MRINFSIQEAGCLLYVADENLGAYPFAELHNFFSGVSGLKDLTLQGAIMATSLYQDDGYNVRVVTGDLSEEEKSGWTSKVSWKLNISSGKMAVSGVCDEDLEEYLESFPAAGNEGSYELGCFVEMSEGEYEVSIYSYPPNDLAGGWMRIESPREFRICFSADANLEYEKPLDYFKRTRPDEIAPAWLKDGWEDAEFLDFLVHLAPLSGELKTPRFESDGCIEWEYRKPLICPVGVRI